MRGLLFILFFTTLLTRAKTTAEPSEDDGIDYIYPDDDEHEPHSENVSHLGSALSILIPILIAHLKGYAHISHTAILHGLDAAWRYTMLVGSLYHVSQPEYTNSPSDGAFPDFFEEASIFCRAIMGSTLYFFDDYSTQDGEIYSFCATWSIILVITVLIYISPCSPSPNSFFILYRLLFYPSMIVMFGILYNNDGSTTAFILSLIIFSCVLLLPILDYVFDFGLLDHLALAHEVESFHYVFILLLRDIGVAAVLHCAPSNEDQLLMIGVLEGCFAIATIVYEPYTETDVNLYYSSVLSYILTTVCCFASIDETGALISSVFFLCVLALWILYAFIQTLTYLLGYTEFEKLEDIGLSSMSLRKHTDAHIFDDREYYRRKKSREDRKRRDPAKQSSGRPFPSTEL